MGLEQWRPLSYLGKFVSLCAKFMELKRLSDFPADHFLLPNCPPKGLEGQGCVVENRFPIGENVSDF